MRHHLNYINKFGGFIKVKGRGLVPTSDDSFDVLPSHFRHLSIRGKGTPAHKKDYDYYNDSEIGRAHV